MRLKLPSEAAVRACSMEMERTKRLDPSLLQAIQDQGLFKMFVPEALGGRMAALPEALAIFEEASRLDGNFGWAVTIGAGGGMFAAYLQPEAARTWFAPQEAVIAGSGYPSGIARKAPGGYTVSGEWKYCSGSSYATFFTANCRVTEYSDAADGHAPIRSFAFRPDQVEIVPDWEAFGLKATESHTIRVVRAFVPEEMTFDLAEQRGFREHPIYRYPFLPFAETSFAAVALGLARHFLEEARDLAERSRTAWEAASAGRYPFIRDRMVRMEARWTEAREVFYQAVRDSWREVEAGHALSEEAQRHVGRVSRQAAHASVECARGLFPYLGMAAVMENSPLNRVWRDLHTATHHSLLVEMAAPGEGQ